LQTAQKWPEIAGSKWGALQNRVRDINGLAQNPIGYRYTIPQRISERIQYVIELSSSNPRARLAHRRAIRCDVLLAGDGSWQARLRGGIAGALERRTPDFQYFPLAAPKAVALFDDERHRAPMTVVASFHSIDGDIGLSLPTRRTSPAYPRGNCRGSIDKLSSERRGSSGSRNLPPPTGHVMLTRQNNNKRRALARSVAKSRHRGYVSETNG
jgi:hypothetical protein